MSETLTKNQAIVLDVLTRAGKPLSAYQILAETSAKGVRAPQQVYRALERLAQAHLAHRIESLNAYQICQHGPQRHQAAFAICAGCGATQEFALAAMEPKLREAAAAIGFRLEAAHIELSGRCRSCPPAPRTPKSA